MVGVGVVGCGESGGSSFPAANNENCAHSVNAKNGNTAAKQKIEELGLTSNQDQDILAAKCQIFEAEEVKRTGEFWGMKLEGKEKEATFKEMDQIIATAQEKIEKLQAEKKTAK